MKSTSRSKLRNLSRFGLYNDTSRGWCFLDSEAGGFRGAIEDCEKSLASFREEFPHNPYRVAQHAPDCYGFHGHCCVPSD